MLSIERINRIRKRINHIKAVTEEKVDLFMAALNAVETGDDSFFQNKHDSFYEALKASGPVIWDDAEDVPG